ncbi:hypothetical protein LTR66_014557 [Elasticomyces elasticus]|nr:hypothetical protein LTR66_014557 [Elasticomyces elasticus]
MAHPDPGEHGSSGSNGAAYPGKQYCNYCGLDDSVCRCFTDFMEIPPRWPLALDEADDLPSSNCPPPNPAPTYSTPYFGLQCPQSYSGGITALTSGAVQQLQENRASTDFSALQALMRGVYHPGDRIFPPTMQDYERVARQGEQPRPQSYQHVSSATSTHHGCGSDSHPAFSDTVPTSHTAGSRQDQNNLDPMEGSSTASARRPVPQRTSQRSRRYDAEDITDKPYACENENCGMRFKRKGERRYGLPNSVRMSITQSR